MAPYPMGGQAFIAYVEQVLVPTLTPGDIVVLGNLPAYSPDFNPIEIAFAKSSAYLRTIAPRSIDALWDAIAQAVDIFTPDECKKRLRCCRPWP